MSTKPTPLINDISDAAGILRAHGHTELAERLLAFAEIAHKTERERAARICEMMRPTGGRAWSAEQAACFEALSEAAKAIRGTANASAVTQGMPGMSELNRTIAYSAANKLRELGFQWDEAKADWIATTDAPATGQVSIKHIDGVIPAAISGYLRRCSSGGMPKKHIDIVQANVDEADRLGYFKLAIAQAMLAAAPEERAIPRLANCGKYTALDNTGQRYYLNHANTWQAYQGDEPPAQHKCDFNPGCTTRCDVCPETTATPQDREAKIAEVERALEQFTQTDPERAERFIQSQLAQLALRKRVDAQKAVQTLKLAIGAGTMQVGGRYKWKHQDERLVYLGVQWSGNRFWHQFALVDDLTKVWCEVSSNDLHMFELDTRP